MGGGQDESIDHRRGDDLVATRPPGREWLVDGTMSEAPPYREETRSGLRPSEVGLPESCDHDGRESWPRNWQRRVVLVLTLASVLLLVAFALHVDPYANFLR